MRGSLWAICVVLPAAWLVYTGANGQEDARRSFSRLRDVDRERGERPSGYRRTPVRQSTDRRRSSSRLRDVDRERGERPSGYRRTPVRQSTNRWSSSSRRRDVDRERGERPSGYRRTPVRQSTDRCHAVDCEGLQSRFRMLRIESSLRRSVSSLRHHLSLCCVESRLCPVCRNGGTPWEDHCACVTGFTGSCCENEIDCGEVGTFSDGQISSTDTTYGTVLTFTCSQGYRRQGDSRRLCQLDGTWSGSQPTCTRIRCDHPGQPDHGSASASGSKLDFGTVLVFSCDEGYVRQGDSRMTCTELGRWTGEVPTCRAVACPVLDTPTHGHLQDRGHVYGNTATFTCEVGFDVVGPSIRMCQADGSWSETQPSCEPSPCPHMEPPENGMSEGQQMSYGSTVQFKCLAGYFLTGSTSLTCRDDQTWSDTAPVCTVCPAGHYQPQVTSATACTPCPPHTHTVVAINNALGNCICEDGWRGPPGGPCERVTCPRPQAPAGGFVGMCEMLSGGQCEFDCNPGFIRVSGDVTRTCGIDSRWSGTELSCHACPDGTYVDAVRRICQRCPPNSHTEGEFSTIDSCLCDTGLQRGPSGSEHCIDINECETENGGCEQRCENVPGSFRCSCPNPGYVIDGDNMMRCVSKNRCPAIPPPEHGGYVCTMQRATNTQRCQIKCNKGYEHLVRPNEYEECGPGTQWSWSFVLNGAQLRDTSFACREEYFPGVSLEASVFFFVSECASLTENQLASVREGFLGLLESQGLCTTGIRQCQLEDTQVYCHENSNHEGVAKRDTDNQVLVIEYMLAMEGSPRSQSLCDQSCATPDECERCLWLYKSNATQLLEQEARRVRQLLMVTTTTTTTMPAPAYHGRRFRGQKGSMSIQSGARNSERFSASRSIASGPILAEAGTARRPLPTMTFRGDDEAAPVGGLLLGGMNLRLQGTSVSSASLHCDFGTRNVGGHCVA